MLRADTQQALETVLRTPGIWRAEQVAQPVQGVSTSYSALDQVLPDSGWTVGALTELLVSASGTGELSLVLPALRAICAEGRGIALIAPPYLPQARAWEEAGIPLERLLIVDTDGADALWAAEQVLRSGECGAVLVWGQAAGRALTHRALQRLHLAAGTGNALCFLYRSLAAETSPSPAPLRLRLSAQAGGLHLHVLKCRGVARAKPLAVQLFPAHWHVGLAPVPAPSSVTAAAVHTPQTEFPASSESAPVAETPPRPVIVQLSLV